LVQRLQENENLEAFSDFSTEICAKRMIDFHMGSASITSAQYGAQFEENKRLANKLITLFMEIKKGTNDSKYAQLDPDFSMLPDISHFIQYTLNCPVGIYNLNRPNSAKSIDLRIVHQDQNHYNFEKVHLLVLSEQEVWYILPARYNQKCGFAQAETNQIPADNFDPNAQGNI